MKLCLCSQADILDGLVPELEKLVGKNAKDMSVAFIVDAKSNIVFNKKRHIDELYRAVSKFGDKIGLINLYAITGKEIESSLAQADVIWCLGGNTDYLKTVFDKSGFSNLLPDLLKRCVWVGSSAGSMILGKRLDHRHAMRHKKVETYGNTKYLEILDLAISPHLNADKYPEHSMEVCITESKQNKFPIYALSDKSALIIDGEKTYMIGTECYKMVDGHIKEQR